MSCFHGCPCGGNGATWRFHQLKISHHSLFPAALTALTQSDYTLTKIRTRMELDLLILLPGEVKKERPFYVKASLRVSEAIETIFEHYKGSFSVKEDETRLDYGLFVPATAQWLTGDHPLGFYDLSSQTKLELRKKKQTLLIWLADSSSCSLAVDWSLPAKLIIRDVAGKLRFVDYADTYGFKVALPPVDTPRKRSKQNVDSSDALPFSYSDDWLRPDETIVAQGVRETDALVLLKRFVDRGAGIGLLDANPVDEHMTFSLARNEILSGKHDAVLFPELQVELSAILLLHTVGRYSSSLSSNYVHESANAIMSPKWRKKPKSDMINQIVSTHMALSNLPWTFDPRGIKQQFIQSMSKISTYGVSLYTVDGVRAGPIFLEDAVLAISTTKISAKKKHQKLGSSEIVEIQTSSIIRASALKKSVVIAYTDSSNQSQGISITSKEANEISDSVSGYLHALELRNKQTSKLKASHSRLSSRHSSTFVRPLAGSASIENLHSNTSPRRSTFETSPKGSQFLHPETSILQAALRDLESLITLQKKRRHVRHRSVSFAELVPVQNPTNIFAQAATHLGSVSRGITSLASKLRSGTFFVGAEGEKSEAALNQWCTAIHSITECLCECSELTSTGIQAIAYTARVLVFEALSFINFVSRLRDASEADIELLIKVELLSAEKALLASCVALDLGLQDRVCEESSIVSLFACCVDAELSAEELISEAESLSKSFSSVALRNELHRAKRIFFWQQQLLLAASCVLAAENETLRAHIRSAASSLSSASNSLLSTMIESLMDAPTYDPDDTGTQNKISRIKWVWGCLAQSLKSYTMILDMGSSPSLIDPMLPPVLYMVSLEVQRGIRTLSHPTQIINSRFVASLAQSASSVVRTLAVLGSVEPSPTIILQSARIESTLEQLRSNIKATEASAEGRFPRALAAQLSLNVFDAIVATVADIRAQGRSARESISDQGKMLVMCLLQLRSTLFLASSLPEDTKFVNLSFVQRYLEQLDAILEEALPFLQSLLTPATHADMTPEHVGSTIDAWYRELRVLGKQADRNSSLLGVFASAVSSQRQRLRARVEACRATLPSLVASVISEDVKPEKMSVASFLRSQPPSRAFRRLSSVRRILTRPSTTSFSRISDLSETSELGSEPGEDGWLEDDAIREKSSQGALAYINESGLLQMTSQLIDSGVAADLPHMSFADAVQICLVTHPYWTNADSLISNIISPYVMSDLPPKGHLFLTSVPRSSLFNGAHEPDVRKAVCLRLSLAMSRLLRLSPTVLQDPSCRLAINDTLKALRAEEDIGRDPAQAVEDNLSESLEAISSFDKLKEDIAAAVMTSESRPVDLMQTDLQILADHLTAVEQRFFDTVTTSDVMKSAWTKHQNAVTLWVEHSNSLSRWIASRILQTPDKKDRAKLISRLIKLANVLRSMNNFSAMFSVYLALSMDCIAKLHKTWSSGAGSLLNQFTRLSEAIHPLHNFAGYRDDLKKAHAPGIPYVGVLMRDMIQIEEVFSASKKVSSGSPTSSPPNSARGEVLSFGNLETISKILQTQFLKFKKTKFYFDNLDSKLTQELLNPGEWNIISESRLDSVADNLEPKKRSSIRIDLPRIAIDKGLARLDSPKASPLYGLRTKPLSYSEPVSPNSSSSAPNGSLPTSPKPWNAHVTECLSLLLSASNNSNTTEVEAFITDLADFMTSMNSEPTSSARKKKLFSRLQAFEAEFESEKVLISLPLVLELHSALFGAIPQLNLGWDTHVVGSHPTTVYIPRRAALQITSVIVPLVLSVMKVFGFTSTDVKASKLVSAAGSSSDADTSATFIFSIHGPKTQADYTTVESSVMSLMSPQAILDFVSFRGRLNINSSSEDHVVVEIHLHLSARNYHNSPTDAPS